MILAIPGVAIFDTTLVTASRLAHRRSPFQGGQDHTSHRLVRLGMSIPLAVTTIYAAGVVLGSAALLMSQLGPSVRIAGIIGLLAAAGLAAVPLAKVPVYEPKAVTAVAIPETDLMEEGQAGYVPAIDGGAPSSGEIRPTPARFNGSPTKGMTASAQTERRTRTLAEPQ